MNKSRLIKIVISIILLILVWYGLYKYLDRPEMTIIVKFKEVPPVIQRLPKNKVNIYYRGFNVGHVSNIDLSNDQKYIVFSLGIYYKNLKLPKNIKIFLNSEDLYGSRHFSLVYPKNPSSQFLSNGDVVYGTGSSERIDQYLVKYLKTGNLSKLVSNLLKITNTLNTDDLIQIQSDMKKSSKDTKIILNNLKKIIEDPELRQEVKSTIKSSSRSFDNINHILETGEVKEIITKAPESINKTIKNLESLSETTPKINKNLITTNMNLSQVNNALGETNCNLKTINCKVPAIPPLLLENTDKTLKTVNCLTDELIEILNKRFLIFRFMFGNPGKSFKKCNQGDLECLKSKKF